MKALGLDIGTTTLCLTVIDAATGRTIESTTLPNDSFVAGQPFERLQNPAQILDRATQLVNAAAAKHRNIAALGVTGQMHGMLYLNAAGEALSPLATWQDERGNQLIDNETYAQHLSSITGHALATGFGAVTHYYNTLNKQVPQDAVTFCTIHDYVAMKLAGANKPLMNVTNAASFGLFDLQTAQFDRQAIEKSGMNPALFPQATTGAIRLGATAQGIPVFAAIGDNQASFLGSVREPEQTVLVNIGTGSQISYYTPDPCSLTPDSCEARPMPTGGYLTVGAALCGGRAYAALEQFFRQVIAIAGHESGPLYPAMDALAATAPADPLAVTTTFSGTREQPSLRGGIVNLGLENFSPAHFVHGVLSGMVDELHSMYRAAGNANHSILVASGNAVRKGAPLRQILSDTFGVTCKIPAHKEEAAYGAALFGLVGAGVFATLEDAQKLIEYQ